MVIFTVNIRSHQKHRMNRTSIVQTVCGRKVTGMADIEKVKRDLAFGVSDRCFRDPYCGECDYYGSNGVCNFNNKNVMRDALSVIEEQQAEIEELKDRIKSLMIEGVN